jgi:uncharacterized protein YjbI with pentapeptide repeats
MSEQVNKPSVPPKRRRIPRTVRRVKPPPLATDEPTIGNQWGLFPSEERQAELKGRLEKWQLEGDSIHHGPFAYSRLTGADVFWLAAYEAGFSYPFAGKTVLLDPSRGIGYTKLHFQGAERAVGRLMGAIFGRLQLKKAELSGAQLQGALLSRADLQGVSLSGAQLRGADLFEAQLGGAGLGFAQLQGALLSRADLQGADLVGAQLEGADLSEASLQGALLTKNDLRGADLRGARFDVNTQLVEPQLDAMVRVADVVWNGVPLIQVDWGQVPRLGDETYLPSDDKRSFFASVATQDP